LEKLIRGALEEAARQRRFLPGRNALEQLEAYQLKRKEEGANG